MNKLKNRKGQMTGTLIAAVAVALLMFPITKWLLSMDSGVDDLQTRMTLQQILADKWNMINAEDFGALDETIASKGKTWTETLGENDRYTVTTVFGNEGKYEDVQCKNTAAGADDRRCRKVALQITDNVTGKTQGLDLTKADSRYLNSRMKKIDDDLAAFKASTNSKFASVDSSISSINSKISAVEGKFSDYYTKSETYKRTEIDQKITSGTGVTGSFGTCGSGIEGCCSLHTFKNGVYTGSVTTHCWDNNSYG